MKFSFSLPRERRYAEHSKAFEAGAKTEDELLQRIWNLAAVVERACDELEAAERENEGWVKLSHQLFNMIPREVWRDHGGDDGQGHYEGEYHAERIEQEIHAALAKARGEAK